MSAEVLRDLARVKAVFQLRAIETVIRGEPVSMMFIEGAEERRALGALHRKER